MARDSFEAWADAQLSVLERMQAARVPITGYDRGSLAVIRRHGSKAARVRAEGVLHGGAESSTRGRQ